MDLRLFLKPLQPVQSFKFHAEREQNYSITRRGGPIVYVIDAWSSNTVNTDGLTHTDTTSSFAHIMLVQGVSEAAVPDVSM